MTIKAWLEGQEFDLQDLAELLPGGAVRVIKDADAYYLAADDIDNPPAGKQFYDVAPGILNSVNGLGRVKNPTFRPVKLAGQYQDGDKHHAVVVAGAVEARARLTPWLYSPGGCRSTIHNGEAISTWLV